MNELFEMIKEKTTAIRAMAVLAMENDSAQIIETKHFVIIECDSATHFNKIHAALQQSNLFPLHQAYHAVENYRSGAYLLIMLRLE